MVFQCGKLKLHLKQIGNKVFSGHISVELVSGEIIKLYGRIALKLGQCICGGWLEQGVLAVASERKVAGEMFWWPSSFVIQVYHDGEFLLLEKAYEEGWLTQKDIRTIAKRHTKQVNSHFPWAKNEEKNGLPLGV